MKLAFALRLAGRESRSSWRRIGLYMSSITLGVAALVAINSFRRSLVESVELESRALLGADLRLTSERPFTEPIQAIIDSATAQYDVSTITNLVSMAVAPASQKVRMVQLRAVTGGFPYYGDVVTRPAGMWRQLDQHRVAVVDPALLLQLEVKIGDTLYVGQAPFVIAGTIEKLASDFSFRSALGPRVAIAGKYLEDTGLMQFGSFAERQAFMRISDPKQLQRFVDLRHEKFRENLVDFDTAEEQSDNLAEALDALTRFLGLVGLAALLLGGVGVASAVHVFIREKRPTVAVLRCLGATQGTVFLAYLLQAAGLGLMGAALGAVLGLGVQMLLPGVLGDVLPVAVTFRVDWLSIATGLAVGVWVASLFALIPLLAIRGISPLQALRREYEPARARFDWLRLLAYAALAASIIGISYWQTQYWQPTVAFSGGLTVALLLLWLTAWLLARATRRFFPRRARFTIRQGVGSLFRPHNQTVSVILALGFGVFVIATIYLVQNNLLDWLEIENSPNAPNLVAFDIQRDQVAAVREISRGRSTVPPQLTPIVPARISHHKGRPVGQLMLDTIVRISGRDTSVTMVVEPWALRREYRHTYRDTLVDSEELIAGKWFGDSPTARQSPVEISVEQDLADDLNLDIGDHLTWDVQGIQIESRVTSLRRVDWARFATNFFVVFPSGVLDQAPQSYVALLRVDGPDQRAELQRDLVARHSNITVIDVAQVQAAFEEIIGKVTLAIRFMAVFSTLAGLVVLVGAVATSRFQRMREVVLLKTIGATRRQVLAILITEYAALGILAGLTGLLLSGIASWALTTFFFRLDFSLPVMALVGTWTVIALAAVAIGLANSIDVLRRPPLAVLREAD
ncbi:MAG: FtsX-like permease family protein [Gemmatimonadota bacterium]